MNYEELVQFVTKEIMKQMGNTQPLVIDYLSLSECAAIIHSHRISDKVNQILDSSTTCTVTNIEDSGSQLAQVYIQLLADKGVHMQGCIPSSPVPVETNQSTTSKDIIYFEKKVLSERELVNVKNSNSAICVSKKTIITPLAKDYIRSHRIEVIVEDVV